MAKGASTSNLRRFNNTNKIIRWLTDTMYNAAQSEASVNELRFAKAALDCLFIEGWSAYATERVAKAFDHFVQLTEAQDPNAAEKAVQDLPK